MTLSQLVHAAPDVKDVISQDPVLNLERECHRAAQREISSGVSRAAAYQKVKADRFNVLKCAGSQWGRAVCESLLAKLVRSYMAEEVGHALMPQAVVGIQLIRDVASLCDERYVEQLLRSDACFEEDAAVGRNDGLVELEERTLRAMRWKLHALQGDVESREKILKEIRREYTVELEAGRRWELGVALATAYHASGSIHKEPPTLHRAIARYKRAQRIRSDVLGELHPDTAVTLVSLGEACITSGETAEAIAFYERALRIFEDTLGPHHPATARTLSGLGVAYDMKGDRKGQHREAIERFERALHIYERTVGRMHHEVARVLLNMSMAYKHLCDYETAEELGLQAVDIFTKTLGRNYRETMEARELLAIIQMLRRRRRREM
jgi:tetratricopeptide (TPR) repeat protein